MLFYATPEDEAAAVRRAVARVGGCAVSRLQIAPGKPPRVLGSVDCRDGWGAAWLLLALAEEDAKTPGARRLAASIRARAPSSDAFARAVHAFVKARIRFAPEDGEIFQSGAYTLATGVGDCDCHARLVYALAKAGGLDARMGILHHGEDAPEEDRGPAHAAAMLMPRGFPQWAETTVDARFGEPPNDAARRLGLKSAREDMAGEVVIMGASDLPPVTAHFLAHVDPELLAVDAAALRRLGYLCSDDPIPSDPSDPVLRAAALAFQLHAGITADGMIGPETHRTLAHYSEGGIGELTDAPAVVVTALTSRLSDQYFASVRELAEHMNARGASVTSEDLIAVLEAESGNDPRAVNPKSGCAGLNQICPLFNNPDPLSGLRRAGWKGSRAEYLALSAEEQIPFVRGFFDAGNNYPKIRGVADLYLANFSPFFLGKPGSTVMYRPPSDSYLKNASVDFGGKGWIEVSDMAHFVGRSMHGPKWDELRARLGAAPSPPPSGFRVPGALVAVSVGLSVGAIVWARWFS